MSFGPKPWHQTNWDFRAAFNFMFGSAGAGLVLAAALAGASGNTLRALLLLGMALIGAGLISVWFEIGRPLRALNVGFNPFTSWMTRESFAAGLVFAFGLAAVWWGSAWMAQVAALAAVVFAYCQARILQAAKGIPAWRIPALTWLAFATALAEGAGIYVAAVALRAMPSRFMLGCFAFALILRLLVWVVYWHDARGSVASKAAIVLQRSGSILVGVGTVAPLVLLLGASFLPGVARAALVLAGMAALFTGWEFKFALITRAAYNQGFALPHLPVRGTR